MSNPPIPDPVRDFFDLPADDAAIRKYLAKEDFDEIARIAASLVPKQTIFDAQAAVEGAMAIKGEVEAAFRRRREDMVETMNYSTLLQIARELNAYELVAGRDDADGRLRDPLVGPVIMKLWAVMFQNSEETNAQNQSRINKALAAADQRSKVARPSLPCDLEAAVRYATGEKSLTWSLLTKGFIDFLGISQTGAEAAREERREVALRKQIEQVSAVLGSMVEIPEDPSSIQREREKLKSLENALGVRLAHRDYRENFSPERVAPAPLLAEAEKTFAGWWADPGSVEAEVSLAWISSDFHEFWEKHGKAYQAIEKKKEKARKKISMQNAEAAAKSATSREDSRCLARTEKFVAFLKEAGVHRSSPRIRELIEEFVCSQWGKTPSSKKIVEFLSLVFNPSVRRLGPSEIKETLVEHGMKAISVEGIGKCLALSETGSGNGIRKKPENKF